MQTRFGSSVRPCCRWRAPPHLGHWFASQHACKSMRGHSKASIDRHWQTSYLKTPGDFAHIAFPMACPPDSRIGRSWLDRIETTLFSSTRLRYNASMTMVAHDVQSQGMERTIADVSVDSPFNRLQAVHADASAKRKLFDMAAVGSAMCVNNVWQTTMRCTTGADAYTTCNTVAEQGSAWSEVTAFWKAVPHKRARCKTPCHVQADTPHQLHVGGVPPVTTTDHTSDDAALLVAHRPSSSGDSICAVEDKHAGSTHATADKCVGESVWGDVFMWRTIMDLP